MVLWNKVSKQFLNYIINNLGEEECKYHSQNQNYESHSFYILFSFI